MKHRTVFSHVHQTVRSEIRQGLYQRGICESKDRHAYTHSHCENEHRRESEPQILPELPKCEPQIPPDRLPLEGHDALALVTKMGRVAKLARRRRAGRWRRDRHGNEFTFNLTAL